ncbi:hypothetical protein [Streptomyces griseoaurantiacus]|uniref:hypothetical protein n=1 Tax=Streptomyces griseoaurantiacus TaxID=68213 RepID=UPI00381DCCB0
MPLDPQIGVRVYQFIVDRLEERRREQHPHGHAAYADDWTAAHDLEKDFATAVHAHDSGTAERLLHELWDMAAQWRDHPQHPADLTDTDDGHTVLETRP